MSKFTRDLIIAGAIAAAILVSLVIARLLTTDPASAAAPVADVPTARPSSTRNGSAVTTTRASSVGPAPTAVHPGASVVPSSGIQIVPRPERLPQSYRPAPTTLPATPPQPPPATPDPAVYTAPAALGASWLAAMCWYDYRTEPGENTHLAAAYGDTSMPTGQDPWALDDQAWARITAGHQGSGCTNITATPAHTQHDGVDQDTVTLTATQVLTVDGAAYQAVPISLTRTLHHGPDGHWLIGPAVTAN